MQIGSQWEIVKLIFVSNFDLVTTKNILSNTSKQSSTSSTDARRVVEHQQEPRNLRGEDCYPSATHTPPHCDSHHLGDTKIIERSNLLLQVILY